MDATHQSQRGLMEAVPCRVLPGGGDRQGVAAFNAGPALRHLRQRAKASSHASAAGHRRTTGAARLQSCAPPPRSPNRRTRAGSYSMDSTAISPGGGCSSGRRAGWDRAQAGLAHALFVTVLSNGGRGVPLYSCITHGTGDSRLRHLHWRCCHRRRRRRRRRLRS
eukprot:scaffold1348_cov323-Prasinococcus_capsulatus_cf.AAC.12